MGPGTFFPAQKNIPDILGRTDFDFENFYFFDFFGSQISGLGPTWAHPRGAHVGPHTWGPRGPTHMGPTWAHPLGPLGPIRIDSPNWLVRYVSAGRYGHGGMNS